MGAGAGCAVHFEESLSDTGIYLPLGWVSVMMDIEFIREVAYEKEIVVFGSGRNFAK